MRSRHKVHWTQRLRLIIGFFEVSIFPQLPSCTETLVARLSNVGNCDKGPIKEYFTSTLHILSDTTKLLQILACCLRILKNLFLNATSFILKGNEGLQGTRYRYLPSKRSKSSLTPGQTQDPSIRMQAH